MYMLTRRPTPAGRWPPRRDWRAKAPLRANLRRGARGERHLGNAPTRACPPPGRRRSKRSMNRRPLHRRSGGIRSRASPVRSSRPSMVESPGGGGASATPRRKNFQAWSIFGEIALFNDVPTHGERRRGPARARLLEPRARGIRGSSSAATAKSATRASSSSRALHGTGRERGKEMALVLARALSDMQLIELRGVIVGTAPACDRARLARATLDELDLRHVPVGVGTEARCRHRPAARMARRPRKARATLRLPRPPSLRE